ncbi:MAG: hypothetical protein MUE96_04995 [Bacteroidia bacterium]|jgi:hypothetical protein|nr:hypothetical protein [Bacteroidia bacterium]
MKTTTIISLIQKVALSYSLFFLLTTELQAQSHGTDVGAIRPSIWSRVRFYDAGQYGVPNNKLFVGGRDASNPIMWSAYPDVNGQARYYLQGGSTAQVSYHAWSGALVFSFNDPDQPMTQGDIVDWKKRMILDQNGNLQLTSGSNATPVFSVVDGHVKARKVTVTAGAIPDYVFAKEYSLMPLNQLRAYIETNKHLPGIASEAEFAANQNQLDIGEMQLQLLQKIEELTLYILQQQTEIDALKQQLKP